MFCIAIRNSSTVFLWGALPLFLLLEIHYEHLHALSVLLSVHASYAASFLHPSCPLSSQTLHYLLPGPLWVNCFISTLFSFSSDVLSSSFVIYSPSPHFALFFMFFCMYYVDWLHFLYLGKWLYLGTLLKGSVAHYPLVTRAVCSRGAPYVSMS